MEVVRVQDDTSFGKTFGGSFENFGGTIKKIGGSSQFFGGTNKQASVIRVFILT